MHASSRELHVTLRGAGLAEFHPLIMHEKKRFDAASLQKAVGSPRDPNLIFYTWEAAARQELCVRLVLEGGPALLLTPSGAALRLG